MTNSAEILELTRELSALIPELDAKFYRPYLLLARETMPDSQFRLLVLLADRQAVPMGELARELSISRPQATAIVDALVRGGYAERSSDSEDRRIILVHCTNKAVEFFEELQKTSQEQLAQTVSVLSDVDVTRLSACLSTIRQCLGRLRG